MRKRIWSEATNIAALLENNLITSRQDLSLIQHFFKQKEKHPVFIAKIW